MIAILLKNKNYTFGVTQRDKKKQFNQTNIPFSSAMPSFVSHCGSSDVNFCFNLYTSLLISTAPLRTSLIWSDIFTDVFRCSTTTFMVALLFKVFSVEDMLLFVNPVCQIVFLIVSTTFWCPFKSSSRSEKRKANYITVSHPIQSSMEEHLIANLNVRILP